MDDRVSAPSEPPGFIAVGPARVLPSYGWRPVPPVPPEAQKRTGWAVFWHVIFGLDLAFLAFLAVLNVGLYLWMATTGAEPGLGGGNPSSMWADVLTSLLIFGLIPLAWVVGTRVRPIEGTKRYLHFHSFWPSVAHGVGYAALLLGLIILFFLGLEVFGTAPDAPTEDRFTGITLGLVLATSAVAGFAEEVLFRGILQKWIGVWGQAIVFGIFHIPGGLTAFFVTGSIGLLFGYLVKNGRSLWLVITAHFAYDLFLLGMLYLSEQTGPPPTGLIPLGL